MWSQRKMLLVQRCRDLQCELYSSFCPGRGAHSLTVGVDPSTTLGLRALSSFDPGPPTPYPFGDSKMELPGSYILHAESERPPLLISQPRLRQTRSL